MTHFHVGQKVVAVGSPKGSTGISREEAKKIGAILPGRGKVYTIRAINAWPTRVLVRLEEIRNDHLIGFQGSSIEPGFDQEAFRPLVERPTNISIFKAMLTPKNEHAKA